MTGTKQLRMCLRCLGDGRYRDLEGRVTPAPCVECKGSGLIPVGGR